MARLLSRSLLATLTNDASYSNTTTYPNTYLDAVLLSVDSMVCKYLRYVPYLTLHTAESGPIWYNATGDFAGRYAFTVDNRPLIPGTPAQIFTSLSLSYALTSMTPTAVDLSTVQADGATGRVYALGPGGLDILTNVGWQTAPLPGLHATSYLASYWAGALTGAGTDPTPPVGVTVQAIDEAILVAASLLAVEMLQMQAAQTAQATSTTATVPAGMVLAGRRVGEREETYRPIGSASSAAATLGSGSPLSVTAANLLAPYRKHAAPALVG